MKYHAIFFTDMTARLWHARPLGAYRLATELRKHGYNVLVIDFLSKWLLDPKEFDTLLKSIISDETLFVGYSGTFFSRDDRVNIEVNTASDFNKYRNSSISAWPVKENVIKLINRQIKTLNPGIKIFYGGALASFSLDPLRSDVSGVDYIVQGFADSYIVDIVNKLRDKKHIQFTLENNCKIIKYDVTGTQFDFTNSGQTVYHESDCLSKNEVVPLETSRGCIFKCKFCSYPLLGRKKNDPSYHKHVSVIADEIRRNYEVFGITRYMFVDDTFNETTEKLQEIHKAIKQSGVDVKFICYLRLDLVERFPEQIELLKEMGMQAAFLGIETLNHKAARAIGKNSDPESVKTTLESMKRVLGDQCSIHGSFIFGLPHETEETINQWMSWVYERSDLIESFNVQQLMLSTADSGWPSELSKNPEKFGYVKDQNNEWISNTGMTQQDAIKLVQDWANKSWESGRLKVGGFDIAGMQNLGFSFEELIHRPINTLDFNDINQRYLAKFDDYRRDLYSYINK